jgi:hypothetical protein
MTLVLLSGHECMVMLRSQARGLVAGAYQDFGLTLASPITPSAKQLKGVLQGEQFLRRSCTSGRNGRRIWRPFAAALCSLHTHARQRPNSNPRPPSPAPSSGPARSVAADRDKQGQHRWMPSLGLGYAPSGFSSPRICCR